MVRQFHPRAQCATMARSTPVFSPKIHARAPPLTTYGGVLPLPPLQAEGRGAVQRQPGDCRLALKNQRGLNQRETFSGFTPHHPW